MQKMKRQIMNRKSDGFPKHFHLEPYSGADKSGVTAFEIGENFIIAIRNVMSLPLGPTTTPIVYRGGLRCVGQLVVVEDHLVDGPLQRRSGGELRNPRRGDLDLLAGGQGLRPSRALRCDTPGTCQNPEKNTTSLPRLSAPSIVSSIASTASPASFLLSPARSATWSTNSDFGHLLLLLLGQKRRR